MLLLIPSILCYHLGIVKIHPHPTHGNLTSPDLSVLCIYALQLGVFIFLGKEQQKTQNNCIDFSWICLLFLILIQNVIKVVLAHVVHGITVPSGIVFSRKLLELSLKNCWCYSLFSAQGLVPKMGILSSIELNFGALYAWGDMVLK